MWLRKGTWLAPAPEWPMLTQCNERALPEPTLRLVFGTAQNSSTIQTRIYPGDCASHRISILGGKTMSKLRIGAIAAGIALALSAGALAAQGMSEPQYKAGKDRIEAKYKSAKAACDSLSANAQDVCMAEAKGAQKVARAELDASNKPSSKSRNAVSIAKADADYAVAKEKCDDKAGDEKNACLSEAKAVQARAKADAKASMKTAGAYKPATKKSTAGEYVDDSVITTKVKAAVLEDASLKSSEINVETSKGRVQLSGFVSSRADINTAVKIAKGVKGVKSVKNDMILKGTQ
jgi:osmotically-inducible protein OsmY